VGARDPLYSPEPRVDREIVLVVTGFVILSVLLAIWLNYAP
jgi:hypothetical protein